MTAFGDLLQTHSHSTDTAVAAVADNCRFDERTGAERWHQFDSLLSALPANPATAAWQDWTEANQLHLDRYCSVPNPGVPDAFLEINRSAWLDALSDNQSLVRIEALTRPLQSSPLDVNGLSELVQRIDNGDVDARRTVDFFLEVWNQRRDARPAFAAFYDEVRHEADSIDWPHALRDRLGLAHYGNTDGTPLPVALMRYPLAEVFRAQQHRGLAIACAVPTVLDGGMHEFFFPVPRQHPFGASVHLLPGQAGTLTGEIVHCRIAYKRKHLWRLGEITSSHELTRDKLPEARDLHLIALQSECDRADFGEPLEGRT